MIKRVGPLLAAMLLVAAACGETSAPVAGEPGDRAGSPTSPEPTASPDPSETPAETFAYEVWFQQGGFLRSSSRSAPETPRVATTAMETLLAGPSAEDGKGVETAIPEGTELLGIGIDDGIATVDLSSDYEGGGGTLSMRMRLAQVVFTLTQFPTVEAVAFEIDGVPVDAFGGEGILIEQPQARKHFEDLAPPIIVLSPLPGDEISSPVTISGTANVFEATVSIRILGADGKRLARTFTTATCGSGCRGDYSEDVAFEVTEEQTGVIEVFEESAEDGSSLHLVRIPVTLVP